MVNSKKRRHSAICNDCNGNGYTSNKSREIIIQCETCDSEGEIYVDESEVVELYVDDDTPTGDVGKLH
jgi:DnaJ-class molecular chaperone